MSGKWPLIGFTVLAQVAVGVFWVLTALRAITLDHPWTAEAAGGWVYWLVPVAMAAGILIAFLHLGSPLHARHAMGRLGSSWLSRELLGATAFFVLSGCFVILQRSGAGGALLHGALAVATCVIGILFLVAMAMVYVVPAVPAWNSVATPVSFLLTAALLGACAVAAAVAVTGHWGTRATMEQVLLALSLWGIALLAAQLVVWPLHLARVSSQGGLAGRTSVSVLFGRYVAPLSLCLLSAVLGAGAMGAVAYRMATDGSGHGAATLLAVVAFLLVLASQVAGRFLFYAGYVRTGL
jgi:anaerobic dimethyl sulfoxide reductase subunit C